MFKQEEDVTIDDWTLFSKCGTFRPSSTHHCRSVSIVYIRLMYTCVCLCMSACVYMYAKQKQPGCKKSARPIRSHNGYKRPKSLISSKAKKLNILLRILLLE